MESLYFLIPVSMVVLACGLWLFFWAVKNGQYDDLDGEAERILFEPLSGATPPKSRDSQGPELSVDSPAQGRPDLKPMSEKND